jgi:xanthine dehydrogenase YagS FAD-binding subunit
MAVSDRPSTKVERASARLMMSATAGVWRRRWRDCRPREAPRVDVEHRRDRHIDVVAVEAACVAPHPSTLATALLAYDATVTTNLRQHLTTSQLLGDGSNGNADHALAPGEIIESIELGIPAANERALYRRAISRSYAEWPLVEVVVRAVIANGAFQFVRIVSGAIAPVPIRLLAAEAAAQGAAVNTATIAKAVAQSTLGAKPLAMTGYKLDLPKGLVQDLLERTSSKIVF